MAVLRACSSLVVTGRRVVPGFGVDDCDPFAEPFAIGIGSGRRAGTGAALSIRQHFVVPQTCSRRASQLTLERWRERAWHWQISSLWGD